MLLDAPEIVAASPDGEVVEIGAECSSNFVFAVELLHHVSVAAAVRIVRDDHLAFTGVSCSIHDVAGADRHRENE